MRILAILFCTIVAAPTYGESPQQTVLSQVRLAVENTNFNYTISHPEQVRSAWIEVHDEPLLLDKKSVPVQAQGELSWDWDRSNINPNEDPEDVLTLSLWDPNGERLECEGTTMYLRAGGRVAFTVIGNRGKFTSTGWAASSFVRIAQGDQKPSFGIMGSTLDDRTQFYINDVKGLDCSRRMMQVRVADLAHASVELDPECTRRSGLMSINTLNEDSKGFEYDRTWVLVASDHSPVLRSVSPAKISTLDALKNLRFVLRGRGFTPDSSVFIGGMPDVLPVYVGNIVSSEVEYVSPTELVVTMSTGWAMDDTVSTIRFAGTPRLRFWVIGKENSYELSEPYDVGVEGIDAKTTALITGVSPFPVHVMSEHSPTELKLIIRGQNFRPENKAYAEAGHYTTGDMECGRNMSLRI